MFSETPDIISFPTSFRAEVLAAGQLEALKGGTLRLKNTRNDTVLELNRLGNLIAGGNGEDGNITLKDLTGTVSICTDTRRRRLDFKDGAGTTRVRIATDQFTESAWPAWPGAASPSRLELIQELRRMKEEILTLRAEVDELKSA